MAIGDKVISSLKGKGNVWPEPRINETLSYSLLEREGVNRKFGGQLWLVDFIEPPNFLPY